VLLLHSTDEPSLAVAAIRVAHGAASAGRPCALFLAAEGSRIAAKGVLEALSGGGRPDLVGLVRQFVADGGKIHVSGEALRERGFAADALLPEASVEPEDGLARLASEGWVFASF
jgi:predicted peroxiredoxin